MPDNVDPNAPAGNGDEGKSKSVWEEAGFATEAEMIETAKKTIDLRREIEVQKAEVEKSRLDWMKNKTNSEFMRQSQELGDLRKKLEKLEKPLEKQSESKITDNQESDEEILESLSDEEETQLLGVLNDPKNVELKKAIAVGGDKAKAEFVRNYRIHAPVEESVLTLKKRKNDTVQLSSIAKAVKDLFKQHNESEKNNLAAVPTGGALPDKLAKAKKQMVVGGVDVDFFRRDKQ